METETAPVRNRNVLASLRSISRLVAQPSSPQLEGEPKQRWRCAGESLLEKLLKKAEGQGGIMHGADAFLMYDTYGFPLELTQEVAGTYGLTVDETGFQTAMQEQRTRSKVPKTSSLVLFAILCLISTFD